MLAGSEETPVTETPGRKPSTTGERKAGVVPMASGNMPTSASGPREAADPSDTLASMEARLARLRARLDELDADIERQRREKKELDIEIAIRKGTLKLLGKEPGADPEKPGQPREDAPRQDRWRNTGRDGQKSVARGGHRAQHVPLQPDAMKRPDKDSGLLELVREAFGNGKRRYGYRRIHLELKGMGIVASAKRIMRLMTGHGLAPLFKSAKRYSSYKGEPDKAPANLVDRDFHAERPNMLWVTDLTEFSIPAGKAYLSPVIDCRHAGRLNDRHQPGLGVGQRHARRRMLHAQGRRETNHPFRPWLPLPVARVDPHPQGQQPDAFDGRERLFSGQRRRGRVLRPSQAGVLPQAQLRGRLDGRVHRDARRLHGPVPGQEDQDGVRTRVSWIVRELGLVA